MSLRGYSYLLVKANKAADSKSIGVKLGRYCIANDIEVARVAAVLGVSRMTVYQWFTGKAIPHKDKVDRIQELLSK